eukprot:1138117-Amorphochlora_amoeboformis.AAC.1
MLVIWPSTRRGLPRQTEPKGENRGLFFRENSDDFITAGSLICPARAPKYNVNPNTVNKPKINLRVIKVIKGKMEEVDLPEG